MRRVELVVESGWGAPRLGLVVASVPMPELVVESGRGIPRLGLFAESV